MTTSTMAPRKIPTVSLSAKMVLAMVAFAASLVLSQQVMLMGVPYLTAVSLHVITLIAAFGGVLVVDWYGLLWMTGRRNLRDTLRVSSAVDPLIWLGLAGVVVTGIFLHPNLSSGITQLKLAAVAVVVLNGVAAAGLRARLRQLPTWVQPKDIPFSLWVRLGIATGLSQLGWWTAMIVGFVNDSLRRG